MHRTIVVLALGLAGCTFFGTHEDPAPPRFDVADACAIACENLRSLSCPESLGAVGGDSCVVICVRTSSLRPLPLGCWSRATDAATARGCGSLRCVLKP